MTGGPTPAEVAWASRHLAGLDRLPSSDYIEATRRRLQRIVNGERVDVGDAAIFDELAGR